MIGLEWNLPNSIITSNDNDEEFFGLFSVYQKSDDMLWFVCFAKKK